MPTCAVTSKTMSGQDSRTSEDQIFLELDLISGSYRNASSTYRSRNYRSEAPAVGLAMISEAAPRMRIPLSPPLNCSPLYPIVRIDSKNNE